jgi:exopolysaccharide biosynthesis polyprenyl glycosylphosphotransferase
MNGRQEVTAMNVAAAERPMPGAAERVGSRVGLGHAGMTADMIAVLAAMTAAIAMRGLVAPLLGLAGSPFSLEWPLAIPFLAVLAAFYSAGLYERDAFMSRPLHAWTVVRASFLAFVASAAAAFLVGTGWFNVTRLVLILTFAIFTALDLTLRLGLLHRTYVSWVKRCRPIGIVVGDSPESRRIAKRLSVLRGFERIRSVEPSDRASTWIDVISRELDRHSIRLQPANSVFIDSSSLSPREIMDVIAVAQDRGADAYVISPILGPLEGSRLLNVLFQTPVTRVRGTLARPPAYALKRALDIPGSASVLLLLSPIVAVLGVIIKATSPGPVFLTQTRVGRSGKTFDFIKFRSMYADADSTAHEMYVHALINGAAKPMAHDDEGNGVFHIVDDPRVTPIGRFIRKYSLDEIPQFWNVLRGDMSLVGPRPPLPYEAREYDDWQRQRLEVQSGITGVWQVFGRNRVSFDEMTFQDLMYGMNRGLWVDLCLCVRTVPAALLGSGL